MIESPCIQICKLDNTMSYCVGCFRSREAISKWLRATDEQKRAFIEEAKKLKELKELKESNG